MSRAPLIRDINETMTWVDLYTDDLRYISKVLDHLTAADLAAGLEGEEDGKPYIAADCPPIPIWRRVLDTRVWLGDCVKQDLGMWTFEPAPRSRKPEGEQ